MLNQTSKTQGEEMTTENTQQQWTDLKGKIKTKWDKFSDADLESFNGNMHLVSEKIQKVYSIAKDKAEEQYKEFKKTNDIK